MIEVISLYTLISPRALRNIIVPDWDERMCNSGVRLSYNVLISLHLTPLLALPWCNACVRAHTASLLHAYEHAAFLVLILNIEENKIPEHVSNSEAYG